MNTTLRQLEVFDAVASSGSITAAAAALNMSPSAASAALKDLQAALQRPPLVHRVGRGLRLTAEGERLHPRVRVMLRDVLEIERPSASALMDGAITVGLIETGPYLVAPLAVAFRKLHPGARVDVTIGQSQDIVAGLTRFAIDLAITDSMARAPGLYLTPIYQERSVLICAPDHPLCTVRPLGFADLDQAEWVMPGRATLNNVRLNDLVRGNIANFRIAMQINSDEGVREAVKAGAGISCLPFSLVAQDLDRGALKELRLPGAAFVRPTYLMRMKNVRSTPLVRAFESFLIEQLRDKVP